jgi:hypothetical protein
VKTSTPTLKQQEQQDIVSDKSAEFHDMLKDQLWKILTFESRTRKEQIEIHTFLGILFDDMLNWMEQIVGREPGGSGGQEEETNNKVDEDKVKELNQKEGAKEEGK